MRQACRWPAVKLVGDAIFRRLQRKAIERSLNKVEWHKLVGAILLTFLLPSTFTAQLAYAGQTTPTPPALNSAVQYQKLFAVKSGIMAQLKKVCKTAECASLATEGAAIITDAQPEQQKGWVVEEDRLVFHDKLDSLLTPVRNAALANSAAKKNPEMAKLKIAEGLACHALKPGTKMVVYDEDRWEFEQLAEICALYLGISPDAAVICMATATLQFGHCLKEYCGGT